jgi:hypothetical protein
MGYVPLPMPAVKDSLTAVRLVRARAEAALAREIRADAELLAREPWRDPASDHYDPLRVLRERPEGAIGVSLAPGMPRHPTLSTGPR